MQVFDDLVAFGRCHDRCVATIGKYDGMHIGHQHILDQVKDLAAAHALPSLVILSEPQPEEFFAADRAPVRLNKFQDKVAFLQHYGIDVVYRLNFDEAMSRLAPETFVSDILAQGLGIRALVIGHDFRFGYRRTGDFNLLQAMGKSFDFDVYSQSAVYLENERVSSTLLRETLQAGNCEKVQRLLGRPYSISGEVIRGRQLGRQLGVPTANLAITVKALPLHGIFLAQVSCSQGCFNAIASVGYNPTVEAIASPRLEVHLFDFDGDLYGETITVSFLGKLREELKFKDISELSQQMQLDLAQARAYFASGQVVVEEA
jgi:riboflavin kinase / FMN adenylyltransferase